MLTLVIFTSMLKVLGIDYLFSLGTASIIGWVFSYTLNFAWVFKPEQKLQFRARFLKFFAASALSLAANMIVLKLIVERTGYDPFWVQMALIPLIIVFNFSTAKFWSLKNY